MSDVFAPPAQEFRTLTTLQELLDYANRHDWVLTFTYKEFKDQIHCFRTPSGSCAKARIGPTGKVSL